MIVYENWLVVYQRVFLTEKVCILSFSGVACMVNLL